MKKILTYFIIIILGWFSIHSLSVIIYGLIDKGKSADITVVFGNKVNEDRTLSDRLKARLDQSIKLYEDNRIKIILVSGGFGKEGFWEAEEMEKYLLENKIPRKKIIIDNHGDNTEKTVENTIRIVDSLHYKKIITVSQYYHQTRIKKLFKKHNFNNVESSSPIYFELRDFYSISREFFAFYIGG